MDLEHNENEELEVTPAEPETAPETAPEAEPETAPVPEAEPEEKPAEKKPAGQRTSGRVNVNSVLPSRLVT